MNNKLPVHQKPNHKII